MLSRRRINLGQVAAVCVLGPMIYHFGPHLPYLVAAPCAADMFARLGSPLALRCSPLKSGSLLLIHLAVYSRSP